MLSTGSSVNGSMRALTASGISSMSEDWMPFQPAIDGVAELELVLGEVLDRDGDVLLLAARIGEAEVDEIHLLVLDKLQYVIGRHRHLRFSWLGGDCE